MQFEHTSPKIADADLDEVELRFGFRFPSEFRAHYLVHNGGRPRRNYFIDRKRVWVVQQFLPIKQSVTSKVSTLERCIQWLNVEQALIPDHLIPFANDSFGNLYCFSTREENCGAIYWLKMEGRRKTDGEFLSDSLDDFLKRLKTKEEAQLTNGGGAT